MSRIQLDLPKELLEKQKEQIDIALRAQLKSIKLEDLYPSEILELANLIYMDYLRARVDAGKSVGIISAQSLGEKLTQGSMNSIDWHEKVFVKKGNEIKVVEIGAFIDPLIEGRKIDYKEGETVLVNTKSDGWETLSVDSDGKVVWKQIEAVTRHLPGNEDGSDTLIKVTTQSKRSVIATKGKSFLVRQNNKIGPKNGDELVIGDRLPIVAHWTVPQGDEIKFFDVGTVLSKKEYLFGSELFKAAKYINENHWWKKHANKDFFLPHTRSDSVLVTLRKPTQEFQDGIVYPKSWGQSKSLIPENIPLDSDFGFFIGAYLAEGCANTTQVAIANKDSDFQARIFQFCNKYNIGYHVVEHSHHLNENWKGVDIILHSTIMAKIMGEIAGHASYVKKVPDFCFNAPDGFVKAFIDGYFSGDGFVVMDKKAIGASSVSRRLIEGLSLVLARYNIFSYTGVINRKTNNIGSQNIQPSHVMSITCGSFDRFARTFSFTVKHKQEKMMKHAEKVSEFTYGQNEKIPVNVDGKEMLLYRDKLGILTAQERKAIQDGNVFYDPIISIEEIPSSHRHVYDFTIADTLTFIVHSGIFMMDTFHMAGVTVGKGAVTGLPRLQELLGVVPVLKDPTMTIYLKEPRSGAEMRRLIPQFQYTTVFDVLTGYEILEEGKLPEEGWHKTHEQIFGVRSGIARSPWVLRLHCDKQALYSKRISLKMIADKIEETLELVRVVFSSNTKAMLDLYYGAEVDTNPNKRYQTKDNALFYYFRDEIKPLIDQIRLTGVNGLSKLFPTCIKIPEAIQEVKKEQGGFRIVMKPGVTKKNNITVNEVQNFVLSQVGQGYFETPFFLKTDLPQVKNLIENFEVPFSSVVTSVREIQDGIVIELDMGRLEKERIMLDHILILFENRDYSYNSELNTITIRAMSVSDYEKLGPSPLFSYQKQARSEHWFYESEGVNFKEVLSMDEVEGNVTMTNSLTEIYALLGIEAARQFLMEEFLANGGEDVNLAHVELLADTMTFIGQVIAVTRHGHARMGMDFYAGASFEENTKKFLESASAGETDPLKGLSANIIVGSLAPVGSSFTEVKYKTRTLPRTGNFLAKPKR